MTLFGAPHACERLFEERWSVQLVRISLPTLPSTLAHAACWLDLRYSLQAMASHTSGAVTIIILL
jgi:hypothetical protein